MLKKIVAVLCSFFCMIAGFMPVFAAEDCQILIQDPDADQTYTAYQIFSASPYEEDGSTVLDNLEWGSSIDSAKLTGQTLAGFDSPATPDNARAIAQELSGKSDTEMQTAAASLLSLVDLSKAAGTAAEQTNGSYVISGLKPGYYLISDTLNPGSAARAQSAILLQVVSGTTTVTPKKGAPTQTKQVKTNANSEYSSPVEWTTGADYSVGDIIDYRLVNTLPAAMSYYQTYQMQISDTMDKGLALNPSSIALEVEADGKSEAVSSDLYTVTTSAAGFTINIPDAKKLEVANTPAFEQNDPKLIVTYNSTLTKDALIYTQKNQNTATLTYSNSPEDEHSTNTTPKSTTTVYTFEVDVEKTDDSNKPLTGAEFTLYKKDENGELKEVAVVTAKEAVGDDKNVYAFKDLGSGTYVLKETVTPGGYSTAEPVTFTIQAHYTVDQNGDALLNNVTIDGTETTLDDNGIFHMTVENQKGLHLPKTGSAGMAILLVVGAAAVVLGILFSRKKSAVK